MCTQELCHSLQEPGLHFLLQPLQHFPVIQCQVMAVKPQPRGSGVSARSVPVAVLSGLTESRSATQLFALMVWFSLKAGICNLSRSSLELPLVSSFPRVSQHCCRGSIFNHASVVALKPQINLSCVQFKKSELCSAPCPTHLSCLIV